MSPHSVLTVLLILRITYKPSKSSSSHPSSPQGPESLLPRLYLESHLCSTPLTCLSTGLALLPPCAPAFFLPTLANSVSPCVASRKRGMPTLSDGPEGGPQQTSSIPELSLALGQDGSPSPQGASEFGSPLRTLPWLHRGPLAHSHLH